MKNEKKVNWDLKIFKYKLFIRIFDPTIIIMI